MSDKLAKVSNALKSTEPISSQDSLLLNLLDQAGQLYRQEVLPGETRIWLETLQTTRPETLKAGFAHYFKRGKFFPKPADILIAIDELSEQKRYIEKPEPQWITELANRERERASKLLEARPAKAAITDRRMK